MATNKTIAPTNVTVQIPQMTDTPDMALPINVMDKTIDGVNNLHTRLSEVKTKASYGTAEGSVTLAVPASGRYCILYFASNRVDIVKYDTSQNMYIIGDVPSGWTITDNKDADRTMTVTRTNGNNFSWTLVVFS